jgi:hypothetical protein
MASPGAPAPGAFIYYAAAFGPLAGAVLAEGHVGLGAAGTVGFLIGLFAGAIVLISLYNASRGSILVVALWHGTWNRVATSDAFLGAAVAAITAILMIAAALLILLWGARNLAPRDRPTLPVLGGHDGTL